MAHRLSPHKLNREDPAAANVANDSYGRLRQHTVGNPGSLVVSIAGSGLTTRSNMPTMLALSHEVSFR